MSERKVLNKYYPPDFDPSKIPRVKCPKNRQFTVRLMAPFNMRCKTCGEYIYKGKKFNARKEDVEGEDYLGIRIFRFYIKCTRCLQEISFKTDPRNTDYEIEAGATRNFMALKLAEEQAEREEQERKEEEASNPMKVLENRTQQSKHELELLESLEELKDLNKRQQSIDYNQLLSQVSSREAKEKLMKMQEDEDEREIRSIFSEKRVVEEVIIDENRRKKRKKDKGECSRWNGGKVDENESENGKIDSAPKGASDQSKTLSLDQSELTSRTKENEKKVSSSSWNSKSVGVLSKVNKFNSLVKIKDRTKDESTSNISDSAENPKGVLNADDSSNSTLSGVRSVESNSDERTTVNSASLDSDEVISKACDLSSVRLEKSNNAPTECDKSGKTVPVKSALSLLTSYSDSDSNDSS